MDEHWEVQRAVDRLEMRVQAVEDALDKAVTRYEFAPVKQIAFGLAALLMVTVLAALLKLVILK